MKSQREILLAVLVIAAFVLVLVWLQKRVLERTKPPAPAYSSFSGARDGCLALYLLLEQAGLQPQHYTGSEFDYPPGGCVAVLGGTQMDIMFGGTVNPKRARLWMEQGGTLIYACDYMMGYQLDTLLKELDPGAPDLNSASVPQAPRSALAGHDRGGQSGEPSAMLRPFHGGERYKLLGGSRLWRGVKEVELALPDYSSYVSGKDYQLDTLFATYDPQTTAPNAEPVIRYRKVGQGALFILDRPEFLTNSWINRADNLRLALAFFAAAGQGRPLLFDESALGYSSHQYNGITIITRTLGGRLLLALAAVLALFWLGQAIRPARSLPQPLAPRRHGVEMVYAQASLLLRTNARHSVAESLASGLRRSCQEAGLARAPSDGELAAWAERRAASQPAQRADLGALAAYLRERFLPRSGSEIAALARACDALREGLRKGERP